MVQTAEFDRRAVSRHLPLITAGGGGAGTGGEGPGGNVKATKPLGGKPGGAG